MARVTSVMAANSLSVFFFSLVLAIFVSYNADAVLLATSNVGITRDAGNSSAGDLPIPDRENNASESPFGLFFHYP